MRPDVLATPLIDTARAGRWLLQCAAADVERLETQLGWPLGRPMLTATALDTSHVLRLGPGEWLLIAGSAAHGLVSTARAFADADTPVPFSLVDVGERQLALQLSGEHAEDVLATGCPLDLRLEQFRVDSCTRTVLGKIEIVLWRTARRSFRVEYWRSYRAYLHDFIDEAIATLAT